MLFNKFNLSNDEVLNIISDYGDLINKYSYYNGKIDEDLNQEIIFDIFKTLTKNINN